MKSRVAGLFNRWGGISFVSGILLAASLVCLVPLPDLRGPYTPAFLTFYFIASAAYLVAVLRLERDEVPLRAIWALAVLFRIILLFTEQTLSDDVYRFIWDGHLLRQGINPYAQPVSSPQLDAFEIPLRNLVNHDWMATPYLPAAQLLFIPIPGQVFAFQVVTVILDLAIAWLLLGCLKRLSIPTSGIIIYLWNPLILTEFTNGTHIVDAWMIFLVILAFWLMLRANDSRQEKSLLNIPIILSMAGATLTKGLPALLVPIFFRRWRWKYLLLYTAIILSALVVFSPGAGWGLFGPLDGRGVFGATRIYMSQWKFNSSLYHWLEALLGGYQTLGPALTEDAAQIPILLARLLTSSAILITALLAGIWAWRLDSPTRTGYLARTLSLFRLSILPVGAYLLLTHTVHPWYVALIVPLLPFLLPTNHEQTTVKRFLWPWLYLSLAVSLSYLTYRDPEDLREYGFVRLIEYLPVFMLLIWAAWPWLTQGLALIFEFGMRWAARKRQ